MTLIIIIGLVFSAIFLGMMMTTINEKTSEYDDTGSFTDIQTRVSNDTLTIAWETGEETQGTVFYTIGGVPGQMVDGSFKRIHSVDIQALNTSVEFYIEACHISGECITSEKRNISMT